MVPGRSQKDGERRGVPTCPQLWHTRQWLGEAGMSEADRVHASVNSERITACRL